MKNITSIGYFVDQDGFIQEVDLHTQVSTYGSPVAVVGDEVHVKGASEGDGGYFIEDTFTLYRDLPALKEILAGQHKPSVQSRSSRTPLNPN